MSNTYNESASTVAVNEKSFIFDEYSLVVEIINDEIFFKSKDLAEILGYYANERALRILDDDEKKLFTLLGETGQKRKTWFVNESGLYHLILKSTKPSAKAFRKWVTGTVLPELRKAVLPNSDFASTKQQALSDIRKRKFTIQMELKAAQDKVREIKTDLENVEQEFWNIFDAKPAQLRLYSNEQMEAAKQNAGKEDGHE